MESVGATCTNWQWSWSFVNHKERFVVFGLWDINQSGLILSNKWNGKSQKQSREHIRLIREEGYKLKTFSMEWSQTSEGKPKIKSIEPFLNEKLLAEIDGDWYAVNIDDTKPTNIAEEVSNPTKYHEGATIKISINAYERNTKARKACIDHYGYKCYVCQFDFELFYGEIGEKFIHVHHEIPLADIKEEYEIDPINHLKPLCPNCHAIIHRTHLPIGINKMLEIIKRKT